MSNVMRRLSSGNFSTRIVESPSGVANGTDTATLRKAGFVERKRSSVIASNGVVSARVRAAQIAQRENAILNEKHRRNRLQAILQMVGRQNIVIARKRSAVVSIFFVDFPFLVLRCILYILVLKTGQIDFPALGVKNLICILLNIVQFTLVRMVNNDSYLNIQRNIAVYRAAFRGDHVNAGKDTADVCGSSQEFWSCPNVSPKAGTAKSSGFPLSRAGRNLSSRHGDVQVSPPVEPRTNNVDVENSFFYELRANNIAHWSDASVSDDELKAMEQNVKHETRRSPSVCVHFWMVLVACFVGFFSTKGQGDFLLTARRVESKLRSWTRGMMTSS